MAAEPTPDTRRPRIGLLAGSLLFVVMLALPPPPELSVPAWRTAAVAGWMAVWWMTEAIPIPATALLPLAVFPLLGVSSLDAAAAPYANPLIFLFLGGFMIALSMERWSLHRRLALGIIHRVGTQPRRIVAGFMLASALLSMWISNTATALMMLPIGISVVALVREEDTNLPVVLMLGIAYACSIGGMATLVGTPTNALLAGYLRRSYGYDLAFVDWFAIGLPVAVVGLAATYVVLTRWVYPVRMAELPGGDALIARERQALGAWSAGEKRVGLVFVLVASAWMLRPLLQRAVPGLSDTGIALAGALALFVVPVDWRRGVFTLDWATARRLPWGVLLLFGGGLSLAAAIEDTGLAKWVGDRMGALENWPVILLILVVVAVVVFLTELTSNTATAAAFLPALGSVAGGLGKDPMLFLVPATLAASCAFMLPVATPPNAIVYGSHEVSMAQMVRAGVWLNVLFVLIVTAAAYFLAPWVLGTVQ